MWFIVFKKPFFSNKEMCIWPLPSTVEVVGNILSPSISYQTHLFTRVGSNPSTNKVMKQESDQEESQWERPPSFEILPPVHALPLAHPQTPLIKCGIYLSLIPFKCAWRSLSSELPPSRFNQFSSVVGQLETQKPKTLLLDWAFSTRELA